MDKPIIFSTNMVKAILKGRKTQTRRVIKDGELTYMTETGEINKGLNSPPYKLPEGTTMWRKMKPIYPEWGYRIQTEVDDCRTVPLMCPYGKPGDILWVRETWGDYSGRTSYFVYRADYPEGAKTYEWSVPDEFGQKIICDLPKWRPSIHMPREASRISLLVKRVGVERLQDIKGIDAANEGIGEPYACRSESGYEFDMRIRFAELWDSINAKRGFGWKANPWVWVIEFEVKQP